MSPADDELRPGDIVVFFHAHAALGDTNHIASARVTKITGTVDAKRQTNAEIHCTDGLGLQATQRVAVYRILDGLITDVTNGRFISIGLMKLRSGQMDPCTYLTDGDRMRKNMRDKQFRANAKMAASKEVANLRVPLVEPPSSVEDPVLRRLMNEIEKQHVRNIQEEHASHPSPIIPPCTPPPEDQESLPSTASKEPTLAEWFRRVQLLLLP